MNSNIQINPRVIQVIQRQITDLIKKAPDSIHYVLNESDILDIQADISGPIGTPYAGGVFRCKLVLSSEFPQVPPKGFFLTKIFHPNISEKGEICVNTLKKDWDPTAWSLQHVLEVIRCLLIVPFPESALNEEAGKEFMEDYEEYAKHARLITQLYAIPKEKPIQHPIASSPIEKPRTTMDISFENSQGDSSPIKLMTVSSITTSPFIAEIQPVTANLIKPTQIESSFGSTMKTERPEEVLMTVTNSLNTHPLNSLDEGMFKKAGSLPYGSMSGLGFGGVPVNMNPTSINGGIGAKKENDDKKKWRKRI